MPDRRTPFVNSNERETLVVLLDYLREAIVAKASGLSEDDARRALVPSATTVLGLVKHLTMVEIAWFPYAYAGHDVHVPTDRVDDRDTIASAADAYRTACGVSNAVTLAAPDLDAQCARAFLAPEPMSLRWVLVHMVEETARHAGHADILREQIDGETGR